MRRKFGMLFQFGALFTDMSRVRERRVRDARAHRAARGTDPRPGADEAQRGGLARRRAARAFRAFGRHGAPRRAGARDRARPDARPVRRAVRRPRSDLARRGGPADPQAQRRARHHVGRRHARRLRVAEDRRLHLFRLGRQDRRAGHAGRGARVGRGVRAPVRRRRGGRPGAVPLSGASADRTELSPAHAG